MENKELKKRPTGVTVLACFFIIVGLFFIIIASCLPSIGTGTFLFILLGVLFMINSYGMWTLKEWARKCSVIVLVITCIFDIGGTMIGVTKAQYLFQVIDKIIACIIVLAIIGVVIWYLQQENVKYGFKRE